MNYFAGTSEVMDNTNLAIVKLMLSCGRNYSFLAAGMTSNKELIGPMLCLGEYNAMCLNSPPPPGKKIQLSTLLC